MCQSAVDAAPDCPVRRAASGARPLVRWKRSREPACVIAGLRRRRRSAPNPADVRAGTRRV